MPAWVRTAHNVRVGDRTFELSNLEKVIYPETGFTKAAVLDYYRRIAPFLIPHLKDRPLTLKRYPHGVDGPFFYQKQAPPNAPSWLKTQAVWSREREAHVDYCLANDLASLMWLVNAGDLELHTSLSRGTAIERPLSVVFDLDPGPTTDVVACAHVALAVRDELQKRGLASFAKVSGSKGMQMYAPLNTATTYEATKPFARSVAQAIERRAPGGVTSNMSKAQREGRIFIDWSQNDQHKTTVNVYSLRAVATPQVSAPVSWTEVERAAAKDDIEALRFHPDEVVRRAEKDGDLFEPLLSLKQQLPKATA